MNQFEEMRNFVRVVEAGSISKAAEQLGIAKSGVSRRLVELESRLGVRLLNRTTRRSSLTESGQAYYRGAVKLLTDVSELEASTADSGALLKGTLRLAVPLSFGLRHLAPAMDEFLKAHPELKINIDFSDRQIDLVGQGVDLAIRIADLRDSSLQARRICPIRILLCASPAYLEQHGVPRLPDDLRDHRVLHYDLGGGPVLKLQDGQGEEHAVQIRPAMVANNGDFLRDMAMAGHGIILTPSFIAWEAVAAGDLVSVMPDFCPQQRSAYAVYPQTRYLSRRARTFIDFLVERFGERPYWDQFG
ncbi:MAG: LysR family transcriptional regulator [Xanthomonadales bacterium]|nr:LysR family transcriptional regulator [Gammaproteobacteria bacterium]NND57828.1 LysR family transcriptional regulator [Xanthomonadales bacterium]NNK50707.1 LysR family transcriptional regulator [Xanthomonadales bacterium]